MGEALGEVGGGAARLVLHGLHVHRIIAAVLPLLAATFVLVTAVLILVKLCGALLSRDGADSREGAAGGRGAAVLRESARRQGQAPGALAGAEGGSEEEEDAMARASGEPRNGDKEGREWSAVID
jgi:hypothetical protein